jgi:hypothetical protein
VKRKSTIIAIILCWSSLILSQESSTLFFMYTLPQSNFINPAVQIPYKVYVGMPLLSSIHFNYSNSWFSYNDMISRTPDNSLHVNVNHLLTKPGTIQKISTELQINLVSFGFLYKEYYFNFSITDKFDLGANLPTNSFQLTLNGNRPYEGETLDLSGLGVHSLYYREWAFGASKILNENLTIEAKVKLLFGKAALVVNRSSATLTTELPVFFWDINSNYRIDASPFVLTRDAAGKITSVNLPPGVSPITLLLNRNNKGLGFDAGFIWKMNENVTLSGSLLDLGLIRWQYYPVNLSEKGTIIFQGINFNSQTNVIKNFRQLADSIQKNNQAISQTKIFYTALAPQLYLGGTYKLSNNLNIGLMNRNVLYYGQLNSSLTASANA